jgi:hypothetical protein
VTVSLTRSEAVVELGKRLVLQLDVAEDPLGSWMAHHISQLMKDVEEADGLARTTAADLCAKSILEIWQHRSSFPAKVRPLSEMEPVLRTLASLDVDRTDYRHYPRALREASTGHADEGAKKWIDLAIGVDYSARLLVQFALRSAAHSAAAEAEPWVELARQAGAEDAELNVVRFILENEDAESTTDVSGVLSDKLARLEKFASLAAAVAAELRAQQAEAGSKE